MIGAAELWGRSQPALCPTTLSTMPPTRPATERIRNPNDALRPYHRSITVIIFCLAMFSTVCAAPLRETPSDELQPLSVQDGFYPLSVGNSTILKEMSRKAFYSLEEAELPEQIGPPPFLHENRPSYKKNKTTVDRKNKPGRKKAVYNGRKELLKILLDTEKRPQQICKGETFKQRVKVPGCLTKTIVNRFCHGVCSSYFIPRMSRKLKAFFKSCAYCGPKEYDYVDVTLDCPGQDPPQITKRITKVKKCACINHDYKQQL